MVTFIIRYSSGSFQGIMLDSGATNVSTAGEPQYKALQIPIPSIRLDKSTADNHNVRFSKGNSLLLITITIPTPFRNTNFLVVPSKTLYLLCINDIDRLGIKFDNIKNVLKQVKTQMCLST